MDGWGGSGDDDTGIEWEYLHRVLALPVSLLQMELLQLPR